MEKYLQKNNINFIRQKRFDWLGKKSLDFYLPEHNIAIECQGHQHFEFIDFFKRGNNSFEEQINRDIEKFNKLKENNIKMLYLLPNKSTDYSKVNQIQEIYTKNNTFTNCNDIIKIITN